jgi:hypothetical protein
MKHSSLGSKEKSRLNGREKSIPFCENGISPHFSPRNLIVCNPDTCREKMVAETYPSVRDVEQAIGRDDKFNEEFGFIPDRNSCHRY